MSTLKPGVVASACNSSFWEVEVTGLFHEFKASNVNSGALSLDLLNHICEVELTL